MFDQIRKLLGENKRLWSVVAAAFLALIIAVWGIWGGFQLEFSQFFAAEAPSCGSLGGTVCTGRDTGGCPSGFTDVGQKTADCDTGAGFCCAPAGGGGGGGGGTPVDPSGACVFKTNFNAPEGAWFCGGLQCQLDGNPSGGQEFPPAGPAASLNVKVLGVAEEPVNPADGPIHLRTLLDATPKCSNGQECYPPKDPLWTCTGPMYQGRNGSDFFSCYNPIVHRTDVGPITCCANTGLPGDCITWDVDGSVSTSTPAPDYPPPVCAPASQTAAIGQPVLLQATSGNETSYSWDISGGGTLQEGGNRDIVISWSTSGQKVVRVSSAGKTSAACIVFVGEAQATPTPVVGSGDAVVTKSVRNTSTGSAAGSSANVDVGQTLQFTIVVTNTGAASLTNLLVRDELPLGLSYINGSTRVENQQISLNSIAATGLNLGTLEAGDPVTIQWSAVADQSGFLQSPTTRTSQAIVTFDGGGVQAATVNVFVVGSALAASPGVSGTPSPGGGPAGVPTGPSDSVLIALAMAALASLLYAAHTRSPHYQRKELKRIGEKRDPLDFRR